MRTLLISAGLCLTAGTFVAAERLTTSTENSAALEQEAATQAAVQAQAEKSAAKIAALQSEKAMVEAQVARLSTDLEKMTGARNALAGEVLAAQDATTSTRDALTELMAQHAAIKADVAAKEAALTAKSAEVAVLTAQIETLGQDQPGVAADGPDSADLSAEIASLKEDLSARDETILALQEQIAAVQTATADAALADGDDASAALLEELQSARATIDELTGAAAETEARLSELSATLEDREATVAELEAELATRMASAEPGTPADTATNTLPEEYQVVSARLEELTELVDSQSETISLLRMGFDQKPETAMEMASACIERANRIFEISQIKFATATSSISPESVTTLDHLRDLAIGCESDEMIIEIGGHTDSQGSEANNQRLSEARANSVREFLIGRGIPAETMIAVGYGETQPIATNDTAVGRAQNRRITFTWQMRDDVQVEVAPENQGEATPENIDG